MIHKFFLILILFFFFSSMFSLQKISFLYSDPFFFTGIRMIISGIILLTIEIKLKKHIYIKYRDIKYFILLGIFNIFMSNIFEIYSITNMSTSKNSLIYCLAPFITSILSFFLLNEQINKQKLLAITISIFGLIPLINYKTYEEIITGNILYLSLPEISIITSILFSSYGWITLKKITNLNYSYILANGISMLLGGIIILIHSKIHSNIYIINIKLFIIYLLITCIISNIICYNLFGYLLKSFSVTYLNFCGLITPIFAMIFGWIFLDENIHIYFIISIIIFSISLIIFHKAERKKI